jgi:hypothetical protein
VAARRAWGPAGPPGARRSQASMSSSPCRTSELLTVPRSPSRFLVGMGNDLADNHDQDGAYALGATLDIRDAYLV